MKINKYKKKKNGLYEVEFENGKTLNLYEEVILKYELLLKPFDVKMMYEIEKYNQECDVYYVALKYLKFKARTILEVKEYLLKKEYPQEAVDKAIALLKKQGYLNDLSYSKSYLNLKLLTSNCGPKKIRQELKKKGVVDSFIEEVLEEYTTDIQKEKVKKLVSKKIASNHTKSSKVLKQKIMVDLINEGFSRSMIIDELSKYQLEDSKELIQKEYDKLYKKLSRKYSGKELELKIKQKMYQKGLNYEEVF